MPNRPAATPAPPAGPLVLVVDDEDAIRDAIAFSLRREGWRVESAADGPAALESARALRPDLIVLDVMLPGLDGYQVCRAIRTESSVPILFLSARGEEEDRIRGLDLGGDDYLAKPFAMGELVARVRAGLRRAGIAPAQVPAPAPASGVLVDGDLEVDESQRRVTFRGEELPLKAMEFDLLAYLLRHPKVVVSRAQLLRDVWNYDVPIDTRTVDVHVRWLRQKIEADPAIPTRIETVRGHGYRYIPVTRA